MMDTFYKLFTTPLIIESLTVEDYAATKAVADALTLTMAGGEQDTNFHHFAWLIRNRGVDMIQAFG